MRMWLVPTNVMCRKHLLGEHVESHMVSSVMNEDSKSLKGFITNGLIDFSKLKDRHTKLENEMKLRGYNHKSPMLENIDEIMTKGENKYGKGLINVEQNLKILAGRCSECKELQIKNNMYMGEIKDERKR